MDRTTFDCLCRSMDADDALIVIRDLIEMFRLDPAVIVASVSEEDPLVSCSKWLEANGYADVIACEPEDVDLDRLDEGLAAYARSG